VATHIVDLDTLTLAVLGGVQFRISLAYPRLCLGFRQPPSHHGFVDPICMARSASLRSSCILHSVPIPSGHCIGFPDLSLTSRRSIRSSHGSSHSPSRSIVSVSVRSLEGLHRISESESTSWIKETSGTKRYAQQCFDALVVWLLNVIPAIELH
jgi:hypothetical protein